jgi:hypothetical protein
MHLFGHTSIMITTSNFAVKGSGMPNQLLGVLLHTLAISGLSRVRTEFFQLLVIPSLAPHPVTCEPLVSAPWRPCFVMCPSRCRCPLDSSNANAVSAPTPGCVCKHCASGRFSTSCSMACVSSAIVGVSRSSNSSRSRRRRLAHGAKVNDSSCSRPASLHQPFLAAHSLVERHRLQLVHDPRAGLQHPVPMPQQLSQIAIFPARYPDPRKTIFETTFCSSNRKRVPQKGISYRCFG